MAFGAAGSGRSGGENISHFAAVRMRVTGSGQLQLTLSSLDNEIVQPLVPITMQNTTSKEPTRLCNFTTQRCFIRLETTEKDEIFRINRIIVFAKEVATSYPGNE